MVLSSNDTFYGSQFLAETLKPEFISVNMVNINCTAVFLIVSSIWSPCLLLLSVAFVDSSSYCHVTGNLCWANYLKIYF